MQLKRSIGVGALLWVIIFFEISILMFGFKLNGLTLYLIHYILLIPIVLLLSLFYFKRKTKITVKEGFFLGIIFVVSGIVLDAVITVPLFVKSYYFFADVYYLIGLIETIILTTILSLIKK